MNDDTETRAKKMASAAGWFWPTLGETGRLGREGWREKARMELTPLTATE